jgi:hypothetical protein
LITKYFAGKKFSPRGQILINDDEVLITWKVKRFEQEQAKAQIAYFGGLNLAISKRDHFEPIQLPL